MLPLRKSHHSLSMYNCLTVNMTMFDAFVLIYYSWVSDNEKHFFKADFCLLFEKHHLNQETVNISKSFHMKFKAKYLTKEGQEHEERKTSKLLRKYQFKLTPNIFNSVLPLFKYLVLILEQKEPLVHRIHSILCENLNAFFACYIKFESLMSDKCRQ